MKKTGYEYYEDNGGGLHLFVTKNGKVVDGITNLEYAQAGEWNDVKDSLNENAQAAVRTWEGHMADNGVNLAEFYSQIANSQHGYDLVCKDGTLYPDKMGRAAQRYFGVDSD